MENTFSKRDTKIVKGVAIIFLLVHHCFLGEARYRNIEVIFSPFSQEQVQYVAGFLKICVGMFVFLTAYGITISLKNKYGTLDLDRERGTDYIKHRLFNLYSGWLFVFALCELFSLVYSGLPLKTYGPGYKGIVYFILDGLAVADLFGTPKLVGTWWYMSLAVTLVIIIPALIKLYRKIGFVYLFLLFSVLVRQLHLLDTLIVQWTPAVLLGILCADKNLLSRMKEVNVLDSKAGNKLLKFILGTALILAMIVFRQSGVSGLFFEVKNGVIPAFFVYFIYEFISPIQYLNQVLHLIGRYSMDIFLVHTLIRATYFRKFIYGFKYAPLIVLVLLGISLLVAVVIELLKKAVKYEELLQPVKRAWMKKEWY